MKQTYIYYLLKKTIRPICHARTTFFLGFVSAALLFCCFCFSSACCVCVLSVFVTCLLKMYALDLFVLFRFCVVCYVGSSVSGFVFISTRTFFTI